ncbi:MAG TPA: hypothetical protein VK929_16075 [Longimicrobiales bacterium]|nr:hypothetical protein [Longimicrobiales bacterium]
MESVFVWCMGLGAVVLAGQIVLTLVGFGEGGPDLVDDVDGASGALNLLSVRSLSAGAVVFGAAGLLLLGRLPGALAWSAGLLALGPAVGAAWITAYLTRLMHRAETSGNLRLDGAVGQIGTVYLRVPPAGEGTGIVQFTLQGRTVELSARTNDAEALATGANVLVISVDPEDGTADVIATTNIEGLEP